MHIHIYHHDAVLFQMFLYHPEKFHGRHLKRNRNILIGIHHNYVIFLIHRLQIGPSVISGYFDRIRQGKVHFCQIRYLLVDFHAFHGCVSKIVHTLFRIGSCSHPQYKDIGVFLLIHPCHYRSGKGIIIIHPCQGIPFFHDRLHAEQYIGGENHAVVCFLYLQIIIDGLPFIKQTVFPKGETAGMPENST